MTDSDVPPRAEDSVLAVTASAVIDAPVEKVWEVLLDFPAYPEWNTFVRSQVVVDAHEHALPSQTAELGSHLVLTAHLPPSLEPRLGVLKSTTRLRVTHLDARAHRAAWQNRMPPWLLRTHRWQWLEPLEDGKTRYETIEVFDGPLAWCVRWFVAGALRKGFRAMADGLKARAEELARA
ncbi:SRPBCC domain-containing protein [Phanerochaete sordida]|uniref:SRPBCC domain-containing protein n=1 Tax=Phanerochaete sordida TaxID=48140 RepID=A0A9P3LF29_9APHY|nr:SRPBCC domain-containing protein [Phanerochaete sordida]